MRTKLSLALFLAAFWGPISAQTAMDTWVMTDGRMFQAELIAAMPGQLKVRLSGGKEETLEVGELSELSKRRAAERLGLGGGAASPAVAPPVTPPQVPVAAPPMVASEDGVIPVTDATAVKAAMGTEITVAGVVTQVATLGAAGHKKVSFEGSSVVVFVGKWDLDKSGDWRLDGLEGKRIRVTGKVGEFRDEVQVQPTSPSAVTVVPAVE